LGTFASVPHLRQRLQTGLLASAALVAAAFWMPLDGLFWVVLAVGAAATWEFYGLLRAAQIPHFKYVGLVGGVALLATTWLALRVAPAASGDLEVAILFLITLASLVRQFPQKHNPRPIETIAGTMLGVLYVPFLFSFFAKLLMTWGDVEGRWLAMYLIVVVKSSDTGAYFVGCSVGRHKLIPRISPAKTWEGCVGGWVSGLAASVLLYLASRGQMGAVTLHLSDALVLGVLLAAAGTVGDLAESLLKRAAGVKDAGRIVMGMGGMLDLVDSLLVSAPVLYIYARFLLNTTA
jgi:phosphatidate cytidylyltransferase